MIEAVGHQFFDAYFHKISELLKPCGAALIQSIVIADNNYRQAMRSVDFIKRYVKETLFPLITPDFGDDRAKLREDMEKWLESVAENLAFKEGLEDIVTSLSPEQVLNVRRILADKLLENP